MQGFPAHQPELNIALAGAAMGFALGVPYGIGWGIAGLFLGGIGLHLALILLAMLAASVGWVLHLFSRRADVSEIKKPDDVNSSASSIQQKQSGETNPEDHPGKD